MKLQHIHELRPVDAQAVIINVSTKLVTTLALMSALKYTKMPVLVIDCESWDGSAEHFTGLMRGYDFDLLSAPLQGHGKTLDWLFTHIPAQKVLLIDSDLEILGAELIDLMNMAIDARNVFGSGFVHEGGWMTAHKTPYGYYEERVWVPLTLLKVSLVREALEYGRSFISRTVLNDFPPSLFISRLLVKRFRIPVIRNTKLAFLDSFRHEFHGLKPSFITYDTGAELYQYLRYEQGYDYVGFPWRLNQRYVTHFHGVTRLLLNKRDNNGAKIDDITTQIERRLRELYGITVAA
jgi:hypothetical protein